MTNELDALRAQVAMLRNALATLRAERVEPDEWGNAIIDAALAATPADALAWLAKREKLAAADVWSEMARRHREYVKAHNPEAYASRGRIEPGYVEAYDDMADIAQEMAAQLRQEAE